MPSDRAPRLVDCLGQGIGDALAEASDRAARVEIPHDWPAVAALKIVKEEFPALRIGVLRPFSLLDFHSLGEPLSDDASVITSSWRNDLKDREAGLVVLGDATGRDEAGLCSMRYVVDGDVVYQRWHARIRGWFEFQSNSETPLDLAAELIEHVRQGRIDALEMDDFLRHLEETDAGLTDGIRAGLWRLSLIPDRRCLDSGRTRARLDLNYEVRQLLGASSDTIADTRKLERLESRARNGNDVAAKALEYRTSLSRDSLRTLELDDVLNLLEERATSQPPRRRQLDLFSFLDIAGQRLSATRARAVLDELAGQWDLAAEGELGLRSTIDLDDDEKIEVNVRVRPIHTEASSWTPAPSKEGFTNFERDEEPSAIRDHDPSGTPHILAMLAPAEGSRDWLDLRGATRMRDTEILDVAATQDEVLGRPLFGPLVTAYLAERARLAPFERWLRYSAIEILLCFPAARESINDLLASWRALVDEIVNPGSEEPALMRNVAERMEAVWGMEDEEGPPTWCTLGPLHPYIGEPLLRIAEFVTSSLGEPNLGSQASWALDRSVPSYRAIWARGLPLFLSKHSPVLTYETQARASRPPAASGTGVAQVAKSYVGFHPYSRDALVLTLVNPPSGRAISGSLRRIRNDVENLRVFVVSTGGDFAGLTDVGEDVQFLGSYDSIGGWLEQAPARSHITFYFTDYAPGREHVAAGGPGMIPGAYVAPQVEIRPDPRLAAVRSMIPYVTFKPRSENVTVIRQQQLGGVREERPRALEVAPVLRDEDAEQMARLREVSDWVVVGAPGPLGLVAPREIAELSYLGKESLGPYGLFVYATSLFAVRKLVTEHLRGSPASPAAEELEERLTTLAVESARGVLRLGQRGAALPEHVGLIVASELARSLEDTTDG